MPLCGSIVVSFHIPVLGFELAVDAIKRLLPGPLEHHVPLVSRPAIVAPPITGGSPWSSEVYDFSINTALLTPGTDLRGPTLFSLDYRSQRRSKHSKTKTWLIANCQFPIADFAALTKIGFRVGESEVFQVKRIGSMSIEQSWRTNIFLSYKFRESCKRELQLVRRGREWHKQPVLQHARFHRLTVNRNRSHCRLRRMHFRVEQ